MYGGVGAVKAQGHRPTARGIEGHQHCAICHPDLKGGKKRERRCVSEFVRAQVREIMRDQVRVNREAAEAARNRKTSTG